VRLFELEDHVKLETWEDIVNRPAHQASVGAQKLRSYRVKGLYAFEEQDASCGASACQKNHNRGFLVGYSGEKETNLCEECGQRLIGTSFKEQGQVFGDQETLRQQQIRLNIFLEQNENLKNRVKELKLAPYGANWLYRSLNGFKRAYPAELLSVLRELANNTEDNATLDALAENDITALQLEHVEQLQGLGIFNADIKETLIGNILKPLKELEEIIESSEPPRSLARFCKWADKVDDHFVLAETLVDEGKLFFQSANMERLKSIPLSEKNTKLTRSLRWDCDGGVAK
jgi:hypothetical protein